jgi:hypothetical protein
MSRLQTNKILSLISLAVVAALGLGIASVTGAAASPEDEIARLNRVRANLFEELVKTRADAAAARAELEAAIKGREAAEAELARLKQQLANATNPVPSARTQAEPSKRVTNDPSQTPRRQSIRPAAQGATGSVHKADTTEAQQRMVRTSPARRALPRSAEPTSRLSAAPVKQAEELPSVLRLQDQR